jgi:hypothetical protein
MSLSASGMSPRRGLFVALMLATYLRLRPQAVPGLSLGISQKSKKLPTFRVVNHAYRCLFDARRAYMPWG